MKFNKWQKELHDLNFSEDKRRAKRLQVIYRNAIREAQAKLREYESDTMPFWKQMQAGKLRALEEELGSILEASGERVERLAKDEGGRAFNRGFDEIFYQAEREMPGFNASFNYIPKETIATLIDNPFQGKRLSDRLWENKQVVSRHVGQILGTSILLGQTYGEVSQQLAKALNSDYYKSARIIRTESNRLHSLGQQRSYDQAEALGIDAKKRWSAALDTRTRSNHQYLNGQEVGLKDVFKSPSGATAEGPGMFGIAGEDINCRCTTIAVIDGVEPGDRIDSQGNAVPADWDYWAWKQDKNRHKSAISDIIGVSKEAASNLAEVVEGFILTEDRQASAEELLNRLGIGEIPVNLGDIGARGQVSISYEYDKVNRGKLKAIMGRYSLQSDDKRSFAYQVKTIFHEAYHAMNHQRGFDAHLDTGRQMFSWLDIEETFAEVSAHYANKLMGYDEILSPSYGGVLYKTLPRLKKMDMFKDATTFEEFGEIIWNNRLAGQASEWRDLANAIARKKHNDYEFYQQYEEYIEENFDSLLETVLENNYTGAINDVSGQVQGMMRADFNKGVESVKEGYDLSGNQRYMFGNILSTAMRKVGVK